MDFKEIIKSQDVIIVDKKLFEVHFFKAKSKKSFPAYKFYPLKIVIVPVFRV